MTNKVLVGEVPNRIYGNKLDDKVAKEAAQSTTSHYEYTRIPKSYVWHRAAGEAKQKLQAEWRANNNAATTKEYFPSLQKRPGTKLTLNAKLAAVLIGHGKARAYIFKGRREIYMRRQRPNHGSSPIPL